MYRNVAWCCGVSKTVNWINIKVLSFSLFIITFKTPVSCLKTTTSVKPLDPTFAKLVEKEALGNINISMISGNLNITGHEMFVKRFNDSEQTTLFVGVHMPDHFIKQKGNINETIPVLVLPLQDETMKAPYKGVTSCIVLRKVGNMLTRYTGHLAYVRKFGKDTSVEWDLYSMHYHVTNGSFAHAFLPIRVGPSVLTVGLGYAITRSRRRSGRTSYLKLASKDINRFSRQIQGISEGQEMIVYDLFYDADEDFHTLNKKSEEDNVDGPGEADFTSFDRPKKEQKADSSLSDLEMLNVPYVGIGQCEYFSINRSHKLPSDKESVIEFYLKVLKADCSQESFKNQTLTLFKNKILNWNAKGSRTIEFNRQNKLFNTTVLNETQWHDYASAVLLVHFSEVYNEEHTNYMENRSNYLAPNGNRISGTAFTATRLVLHVMDSFHTSERIHVVKIANLLIEILQAHRSEVVSNEDELKDKCAQCETEKLVIYNDSVQLYSLIRFIVETLSDVVVSGSAKTLFEKFHANNFVKISEFVKNKIPLVY